MAELYWSSRWADVVGTDGHLITRLVGTTAPLLSDEQVDAIRRGEIKRFPTRGELDNAQRATYEAAEANGLRVAWSAAAQSADRAVRAGISDEEISSDRWHIWQPAIRSAVSTAKALVVRPFITSEQFETLTCLWGAAVEPIPARIETDGEVGAPAKCPHCGGTAGAPGVSQAEAARYARHLRAGDEHYVQHARTDLDAARAQLAEYMRTHWDPEHVRNELARTLDNTPGVSAKARAEIEKRFGVKSHHGKPWNGETEQVESSAPAAVEAKVVAKQPRPAVTEAVQEALL